MAGVLGYKTETIQMYADMTARDLLQQRTTIHTGETVWRLSPLIKASLEGKMAVLDGVHRVHRGTLAVLQRLIHDREVQLYDGTRLLARDKYDLLLAEHGRTAEEMAARSVLPIQHPAFRLAALAEPPTVSQIGELIRMPKLGRTIHKYSPVPQACENNPAHHPVHP